MAIIPHMTLIIVEKISKNNNKHLYDYFQAGIGKAKINYKTI